MYGRTALGCPSFRAVFSGNRTGMYYAVVNNLFCVTWGISPLATGAYYRADCSGLPGKPQPEPTKERGQSQVYLNCAERQGGKDCKAVLTFLPQVIPACPASRSPEPPQGRRAVTSLRLFGPSPRLRAEPKSAKGWTSLTDRSPKSCDSMVRFRRREVTVTELSQGASEPHRPQPEVMRQHGAYKAQEGNRHRA